MAEQTELYNERVAQLEASGFRTEEAEKSGADTGTGPWC